MTAALLLSGALALALPAGDRAICADTELPSRCRRLLRYAEERGLAGPVRDALSGVVTAPGVEGPVPDAPVLRVATWNAALVHFFGDYQVPLAAERRERLHAHLDALFAESDVLLLQEVYLPEDRAIVADFAASRGLHHVDGEVLGAGRCGLHLLSAFPLPAHGVAPLPQDPFRVAGWTRVLLWARVAGPDGEWTVGNVHLTPLPRRGLAWDRARQLVTLRAALEDAGDGVLAGERVVLGGDLNVSPSWAWPGTPGPEEILAFDARLFGIVAGPADSRALRADAPLWTLYRENAIHTSDPFGGTEPDRQVDHLLGFGVGLVTARTALRAPLHEDLLPSDHYALIAEFVPLARSPLPADPESGTEAGSEVRP